MNPELDALQLRHEYGVIIDSDTFLGALYIHHIECIQHIQCRSLEPTFLTEVGGGNWTELKTSKEYGNNDQAGYLRDKKIQ